MPTHWVLDQNFPWHASTFPWPPDIRISRLAELDARLVQGYDDWQVLLELALRGDVTGFITNDDGMLNLPTEMVALERSRLVLVVARSAGHQVLRPTGLILSYLEEITRRLDGSPRIYIIKAGNLQPQTPGARLNEIARHRQRRPNELHTAETSRIEAYLADRRR